MPGHDPAERARRLARLAVELHDVAPARPAELLVQHLGATLRGAACELGFERTLAWAGGRGLDVRGLAAWALSLGAVCDCELCERISS